MAASTEMKHRAPWENCIILLCALYNMNQLHHPCIQAGPAASRICSTPSHPALVASIPCSASWILHPAGWSGLVETLHRPSPPCSPSIPSGPSLPVCGVWPSHCLPCMPCTCLLCWPGTTPTVHVKRSPASWSPCTSSTWCWAVGMPGTPPSRSCPRAICWAGAPGHLLHLSERATPEIPSESRRLHVISHVLLPQCQRWGPPACPRLSPTGPLVMSCPDWNGQSLHSQGPAEAASVWCPALRPCAPCPRTMSSSWAGWGRCPAPRCRPAAMLHQQTSGTPLRGEARWHARSKSERSQCNHEASSFPLSGPHALSRPPSCRWPMEAHRANCPCLGHGIAATCKRKIGEKIKSDDFFGCGFPMFFSQAYNSTCQSRFKI